MGDVARKSTAEAIASFAGGTAGPIVTALIATAAAVTGRPDLAAYSIPAGAMADAVTEQAAKWIANAFFAERVSSLVEAVEDESGQPIEDFINEHVTDTNTRKFLGHIVDAATDARSDWKIRLLARALIRGAKDGEQVNESEMFIEAVRELEPAHARALIATYEIFTKSTGQRISASVHDLRKTDAGLGRAAPLLWRKLREYELIEDVTSERGQPSIIGTRRPEDSFRITDLGIAIAEWLRDLGAEPSEQQGQTIPRQEQPDASGGQGLRPGCPESASGGQRTPSGPGNASDDEG